jgi:hypothetical protein
MLTFYDLRASDVFAAGGDVRFVSGAAEDDLVATGGDISLENDFSVAGSAVLAGGTMRIRAPVGRDLRAAGGRIDLDASVGGDVEIDGDFVALGPNTRIAGKLTHRARRIDISPQAQITGEVVALPPRTGGMWAGRMDAGDWITVALLGIAMLVVLSCAAMLLLPGLMRDAERAIRERPLVTLGIGVLIAIASPVGFLLLAITVIGLPVAFVLLMLLLATLPLAIAAFVHFSAMKLRGLAGRAATAPSLPARLGWTGLAAIILALVGMIPWIGWLVWLAAYAFGIGAVATEGARALFRGAGPRTLPGAPA